MHLPGVPKILRKQCRGRQNNVASPKRDGRHTHPFHRVNRVRAGRHRKGA